MSEVTPIEVKLRNHLGEGELKLSELDITRMMMLLEERTYLDAARRLGISESAMKQTMSNKFAQFEDVQKFYKDFAEWMKLRREFKKKRKKQT